MSLVDGDVRPASVGLAFEGVVADPRGGIGPSTGVDYATRIEAAMSRVFAIEYNGVPLGTGVLVGPDLALTNFHVLNRFFGRPASGLYAKLDYRSPDDATRHVAFAATWDILRFPPSPKDTEAATAGYDDDQLDFALVRLSERVGEQQIGENPRFADRDKPMRGWEMLRPLPSLPEITDPVHLIHHPGTFDIALSRIVQREVTVSEGKILAWIETDRRLRHNATTAGGSSGGACFSIDWSFLALHHMGDPTSPWSWLGKFNQAIPVNAIARRIATSGKPELAGLLASLSPDPRARKGRGSAPAQITTDISPLVEAAKCLLDRSDNVRDILESLNVDSGMVHVVVCRDSDEYTMLNNRLRRAALPLRGAVSPGSTAVGRLAADGLQWGGHEYVWPRRDYDVEKAANALKATLLSALDEEGFRGKPTLLVFVAKKKDWNPERDRELLQRFAKLCASQGGADILQVVVVYFDDEAMNAALRDRETRETLGKVWPPNAPPEHCGACMTLDDVAAADLYPWSEAVSRAWGVPQSRIDGDVRARLKGAKLPMRDLHTTLEPDIARYAAEHLLRTGGSLR